MAFPPHGTVLALVGGLDGDLDARAALDDHAVGAVPVGRRRPVRRAGGVDAGDVLDDDPGLSPDDPLHLEAHGALGTGRELTHGAGVHRGRERAALQRLADVVEFDAERPCHEPYLAAPHHGRDRRGEHQRLVVHRLPHADQVPDGFLLFVRGVVEDLLAADGVDRGAETADQQGQHVIAPAGIDSGDEQGAAAVRDGGEHGLPELRRGIALVVERIEGGRDDHRTRPDRPADVGEGLVGADVAGGRVDHGSGATGQDGVDVVARRDPEGVVEPGEFARVPAGLVGVVDEHGREFQLRVGLDGADGRAADIAGTPDHRGNHAAEGSETASRFL